MILGVAIILAMVVLLIVCLRRKGTKVVVGEVAGKDDPIFRKVSPCRTDSIADSISSNVTSDRHLKQVGFEFGMAKKLEKIEKTEAN